MVNINSIRVSENFTPHSNGEGQIFQGVTIYALLPNAKLVIEYDYYTKYPEVIVSNVFEHLSGNQSLPSGVSSIKIVGV